MNHIFVAGVLAFVLALVANVAQTSLTSPADPQGSATRYPIVLMHGLLGGPVSMKRIEPVLLQDGHKVFVTGAPPLHSIETRAKLIAGQIDVILQVTQSERVNLIAHSMGGLDARYLISILGYADKVASLTTVSTSHHGMPLSGWVLGWLTHLNPNRLADVGLQIGRRLNVEPMARLVDVVAGFSDLTGEAMRAFNEHTPNVQGVYYQSWSGLSKVQGVDEGRDIEDCGRMVGKQNVRDAMDAAIVPLALLTLAGNRIASDGIVPVSSAKWGNFRGCVHADHLDLLGLRAQDRHSGFDYKHFYRAMAFELSALGF